MRLLQKIDGVVRVERLVCGGCNDFKIQVKVEKSKFGVSLGQCYVLYF